MSARALRKPLGTIASLALLSFLSMVSTRYLPMLSWSVEGAEIELAECVSGDCTLRGTLTQAEAEGWRITDAEGVSTLVREGEWAAIRYERAHIKGFWFEIAMAGFAASLLFAVLAIVAAMRVKLESS